MEDAENKKADSADVKMEFPREQLPSEEVKRPEKPILTVLVKWLFFSREGQEVKVLQNGKVLESVKTDRKGQALFELKPGEYEVAVKNKSTTINLQDHAVLKF